MAKIGSKLDELRVPLLTQEKTVLQFTPRLFVCSSSQKSKQKWSEDFYWQFKSDIDALKSEWVASVPVVSITQYAVDEEGVIESIDKVNAVFPELIENCSGVTHEGSVLVGLTKDEVSAALCKKELWHKMQHFASRCAPRDLKDSQSVFWKVAALRRMQETWQVYNLCEDIAKTSEARIDTASEARIDTASEASANICIETFIHLVPPFQYGHVMLAQQNR